MPNFDSKMRRFAWPLVGWTVFVWISRIRNVVNADEIDTTGKFLRLVVVAIFLGFAGLLAAWIVKGSPRWALAAASIWSVGFWLVRGGGILLDPNHDTGFKAIHTALMIATFAVVALAWYPSRSRRPVAA